MITVELASITGGDNPTLQRLRGIARRHPPLQCRIVDAGDADLTILVESGYLGLPDLLRHVLRGKRSVIVFSEGDWPFPFLPGFYCSIEQEVPWAMSWSFLLDADLTPEPMEKADLLFSFVGRTDTHACRPRLIKHLDTPSSPCLDASSARARFPGWNYKQGYLSLMARSRFCLCPRGFGSSSIRLFEAMRAGRVPIIISDAWIETPGISWNEFSIRVPEAQLHTIRQICESRVGETDRMGALARRVYEQHFAPENFVDRMLVVWRDALNAQSSGAATTLYRAARTAGLREIGSARQFFR